MKFVATGHYVPKQVVTNAELTEKADWVESKLGIKTRHKAAENDMRNLDIHCMWMDNHSKHLAVQCLKNNIFLYEFKQSNVQYLKNYIFQRNSKQPNDQYLQNIYVSAHFYY